MAPRTTVLLVAAALVAAGGVYLLLEVRSSGAAAPSGQALAEAAARRPGVASSSTVAQPRQIEDLGAPGREERSPRPERVDKGAAFAPQPVTDGLDPSALAVDPVTNPDFDAAMLEANKLYDRHNYEDARALALKLLERQPGSVRMLRVVVSSSCILADAETAQKYWSALPEFDRGQMASRCEKFDVVFKP